MALAIEFAASTLLYERASRFAVKGDEAHRLAQHLVIARRLVDELPVRERAAMARELTTARYQVRWTGALPAPPPIAPELAAMRRQVLAWEPALADADLRLRLLSPGRRAVVASGVRLADGSWLYVRSREPVAALSLALERIALAMVPAVALMILGALLLRRSLQPLRMLAQATRRVGAGTVVPVPEVGTGEVRRVIAAFNRMQERIRDLIAERTQALAAVGHDLRTPLARVRLRGEALTDAGERTALFADVDEMDEMIAALLAFLRGADEPEPPAMVDLAVLCATLADDAADQGHDVVYAGPDHHEQHVRRLRVKRALGNLLANALRHGNRVAVTLEAGHDATLITVDDDGPGIPSDKLALVTQPFVRLDAARGRGGEGFGLGLAIVTQVAAAEGGRLELANRTGGGFRAALILSPAGSSGTTASSDERGAGATLLLATSFSNIST